MLICYISVTKGIISLYSTSVKFNNVLALEYAIFMQLVYIGIELGINCTKDIIQDLPADFHRSMHTAL